MSQMIADGFKRKSFSYQMRRTGVTQCMRARMGGLNTERIESPPCQMIERTLGQRSEWRQQGQKQLAMVGGWPYIFKVANNRIAKNRQ